MLDHWMAGPDVLLPSIHKKGMYEYFFVPQVSFSVFVLSITYLELGESKLVRAVPFVVKDANISSKAALMEEKQQFPRISVVILALNEAQNLRHVQPLIPWFVHEIILVDACSTDDTVAVVQQLGPTIQPPIHIIKQTGKGKGHALRMGFATSEGDIIVTLDVDGSTDPREIPFFVEALNRGNDFTKGSRCVLGGGSHDFTVLRRLGNYGLRKLVNLLFRTRFTDLVQLSLLVISLKTAAHRSSY